MLAHWSACSRLTLNHARRSQSSLWRSPGIRSMFHELRDMHTQSNESRRPCGLIMAILTRPLKACSFSTSSRIIDRILHHGCTNCGRNCDTSWGHTRPKRPTAMAAFSRSPLLRAVLLMRAMRGGRRLGMTCSISAPMRTASSPRAHVALLHTLTCSGVMLPWVRTMICPKCGLRWLRLVLVRSPTSANALWRTAGSGCWQHIRSEGRSWLCPTRLSTLEPMPSAREEMRSRGQTMKSLSSVSSSPVCCLCSPEAMRRSHRWNTGGADAANPCPRAWTTDARHSRRGKRERSSSVRDCHLSMRGGRMTWMCSGLLSSDWRESAKVPQAS
mmetsp:Transcript_33671/g.85134  ORF Transcript_33671/g.85134 Transcript_33671/m.85134 type:complete len:329 (-) Transcript_33671:1682-2668(-)